MANPNMAKRTGLSADSYNADDYFSDFEAEEPKENARQVISPQNADDFFSQHEQQQSMPPSAQSQTPAMRVANAFQDLPIATQIGLGQMEPGLGTPGGSIERALQRPVGTFVQKYPEASGALAGVVAAAALPEGTLAGMLPIAGRGLWALTKYAGKKLTDYEILSHLLHP